jgi:hypothetical protein
VSTCREFKIRVGNDKKGRIIHPVMLVKTPDPSYPYQWSISDGCTRQSAHAMMHLYVHVPLISFFTSPAPLLSLYVCLTDDLGADRHRYETLTAARTCKFVVPVTEGDCFSTDPEAVFQLLASLDRETFSKFDDADVKCGNAVPTVISVGLKQVKGSSKLDTRTILLNSCFSKALVDRIAPPPDAAIGSPGLPWYDCTIDFTNGDAFGHQDQDIDEKKRLIEYRKFHTVPARPEGYADHIRLSSCLVLSLWFSTRVHDLCVCAGFGLIGSWASPGVPGTGTMCSTTHTASGSKHGER